MLSFVLMFPDLVNIELEDCWKSSFCIWELPNAVDGGFPCGVNEFVEDGGGPAGVVVTWLRRLRRLSGVEGGVSSS